MRFQLFAVLLAVLLTVPAFAQVDPSGEWAPRFHEDQPERIPGPEIGDYLGLPINDAARLRADSWDASLLTLPEHQCKPHPADYSPRGPANLRITKEVDKESQEIVAFHTHISWQAPERTIWMNGREHPPDYAAHTWQGFSTGKWEGDMLTVTTTHLKAGWIRRNGVPRSDRATLTEHWIRHGDYLTLVRYMARQPVSGPPICSSRRHTRVSAQRNSIQSAAVYGAVNNSMKAATCQMSNVCCAMLNVLVEAP